MNFRQRTLVLKAASYKVSHTEACTHVEMTVLGCCEVWWWLWDSVELTSALGNPNNYTKDIYLSVLSV